MTTIDSATGFYVCPMFNVPCRHCSIHTTVHPYTKIRPNSRGRYFDSAGLGKRTEIVGEFCNNDGTHLVQDLQYCPARWGLRGAISMGTLDAPVGRFAGGIVTRAKKATKVGKPKKPTEKKKPAKRNTKKKHRGKRRVKRAARRRVKPRGKNKARKIQPKKV